MSQGRMKNHENAATSALIPKMPPMTTLELKLANL
jgi:hypothetical protein